MKHLGYAAVLLLLVPAAAGAAVKPFAGPAGWQLSETRGLGSNVQQAWKSSGQSLNFIYDDGLRFDDVIGSIETTASSNRVRRSISLHINCDGRPAYEVAMNFGTSYVRQLVVDEGPGVAKLTYVRPGNLVTPDEVVGAFAEYCNS